VLWLLSMICMHGHMLSSSITMAVQPSDPLGKLVSLGVTRSVSLLCARKISAAELHRQLAEMYESDTKSCQQVAKTCRTFACVRHSVTNDNLSRRQIFFAEVNTVRVEELLQSDRRAGVYLLAMVSLWCRVTPPRGCVKTDSHIACCAHAVPMSFPCPAVPLTV
jgi:hypothetical protein